MSQFTEGLKIEWLPEEELFRVIEAFDYHVGSEESLTVIHIPVGFKTDLASIPFWARWLIHKLGKHAQAAVVHDFLYKYKMFTRKECDLIFLEAMGVLKVILWKRRIMYRAVRVGGSVKRDGLKVYFVNW